MKGKSKKVIIFIVGGLVLLCCLCSAIIAMTPTTNNTTNVAESTPAPTEQSTVKEEAKPTSPTTTVIVTPNTKAEPSIMDKLWTALDISLRDRDKYDIKYYEDSKTVEVIKKPYLFWDETSFVEDGLTDFVRFGIEASKIEGVNTMKLTSQAEFTDSKGKKTIDTGLSVSMSKEVFNSYNWKNLESMPIYDTFRENSELFIPINIMYRVNRNDISLGWID